MESSASCPVCTGNLPQNRWLNAGCPGHKLMLKHVDCSSPNLSPLLLPHLLTCLHSVCVCRQFYFFLVWRWKQLWAEGLECLPVAILSYAEFVSEGQSCLYRSSIKDEWEILFKGMKSPCLCLTLLAECSSLSWCWVARALFDSSSRSSACVLQG